eukprot:jgi/Picsp_1/6613/NSC_03956-R1_---NA---
MESKIIADDGVRSQFEGRASDQAAGTQGVFGGMGLPVAVSREKENSAGVRAIHFIPYTNGYYDNDERGMELGRNVNFGASQNMIVPRGVLAQQKDLIRDTDMGDRYFESIGSIISEDAASNLKTLFDEYSNGKAQKGAPLLGSREDEEFWLGCFGQLPKEARDECILKGFGTARYTEIKLREEDSLERLCGLTLSDDFPEPNEIHKAIKGVFKKNLQLECAVILLEERCSDVEIINKVLELVETRLKHTWTPEGMKELTDEIRGAIVMHLKNSRLGDQRAYERVRKAFHEQQREKISQEFGRIRDKSPGIMFCPQEEHVKKFNFLSNAESDLFIKLKPHRVPYMKFLKVYHGLYNRHHNEVGATEDQWIGPTNPPGGSMDTPFALFRKVQREGGYDKVCQEEKWASLFPVHGNAMKLFYQEHIGLVENELAKGIMVELKPILAKMKAIGDFEVDNTSSSSDTLFSLWPDNGVVYQQPSNSATKRKRRQSNNGAYKYKGETFTFRPSQESILNTLKTVEENAARGKFKYKNTFFPIFGLSFGSDNPKAQFKSAGVILPIQEFVNKFEQSNGRKPLQEEVERFLDFQKRGGIDKSRAPEQLAEYSQFKEVETFLIEYALKSKTFFDLNSQKN